MSTPEKRPQAAPEINPNIFTGAVAPATAPIKIGDIYIDTVLAKVYISAGVSASTDWKVLN